MSDAEQSGTGLFDPVVETDPEFVIADGQRHESYHRRDPETEDVEPACRVSRKVDRGWREAPKNKIPWLNACSLPGCFGGESDE